MLAPLLCAVLVAVYVNPLVTTPLASFHFEVGALFAWGLLLLVLPRQEPIKSMGLWGGLLIALCLLPGFSIALQLTLGHSTIWQLTLMGLYFHLAMLLVARAGWTFAGAEQDAKVPTRQVAHVLLLALVAAALLNGLAAWFQFLFPGRSVWFVAQLGDVGRAFGNLRQPNQFALFMVWGLLAVLAAHAGLWRPGAMLSRAESDSLTSPDRGGIIRLGYIFLAFVLTVAVTMSGSRTGALLVWMTALLVGLIPGLPKRTRWLACSMALVHLLTWLLFQALDRHNLLPFFSVFRGVASTVGLSDSRMLLWADVLVLVQTYPITGVGYGMLNHALNQASLLGLPATNNAHNLFLHLAVEQGLPLALLWSAGLTALLVRLSLGWREPLVRFLMAGVLAAFLHSQLEFPLMYAHLLLPVVFALGALCRLVTPPLGGPTVFEVPEMCVNSRRFMFSPDGLWALLVMVVVPLWAATDYRKVSPIYEPSETPMLERIVSGHSSSLFTHLADFASFTAIPVTVESAETHYRLGQRVIRFDFNELVTFQLMMAAGFTQRWEEAAVLHARLSRYFGDRLRRRVSELSPEARGVYEKILAHSMSQTKF